MGSAISRPRTSNARTPTPKQRGRSRELVPRHARSSTGQTINDFIRSQMRVGGIGAVSVRNPYEESPAIYRAIVEIAGALVEGDLGVWRKARATDAPDERVVTGDAFELIEYPCGLDDGTEEEETILTKEDFLFILAAQAMLGRSAGCLIVPGRLTDAPVRLLPLPPGSLRILRPASDPWKILGWRFSWGGHSEVLRPKDACRFKFAPDIFNLTDGVGPGLPATTAIDTRQAATLYNKYALENGGNLGGILQWEGDEALNDDQTAEVRRRFTERHSGPRNAEKVAVISGRYKWIETGKSARDMSFPTLLSSTLEDIVRPFGIPPLFMGVLDHSALSRAVVAVEKGLLTDMVERVGKRFAATFTRIVRRIDREAFCKWDFSNVPARREDETERLARAEVLFRLGIPLETLVKDLNLPIKTLPEHSKESFLPTGLVPTRLVLEGATMGLGPVADGEPQDQASVPRIDSTQIEAAKNIVKDVEAGSLPRDSGIALLTTLLGDASLAANLMGSAGEKKDTLPPAVEGEVVPDRPQLPPPDDTEERTATRAHDLRARAWRAYVRQVQPHEDAIKGAYRKNLNRQRAVVLAAVEDVERSSAAAFTRDDKDDEAARRAKKIAEAFDSEELADFLRTSIQNAYVAGAKRTGDELVDIGIATDAVMKAEAGRLPKVSEKYWAAREARVVGVGDRIRGELRESLLEGYVAGENLSDLKDRVREVIKENLSTKQARQIARTEAHTAVNNGRFDLMKRQGVEKHEWLSAQDDNVREGHNIDGERVKVGDEFSNGLRFPGDPTGAPEGTINCVLPGTFVSGRPQVILRGFYAGEAIEIETRRGNRVSVTINHPVLTPKGIVPARALKKGDYVIGECADVEAAPPRWQPQYQQGKARIEDLFDAFSAHGSCWSRPTRPFDFDGDGRCFRKQVDFVEVLRPLASPSQSVRYPSVVHNGVAAGSEQIHQVHLEVPRLAHAAGTLAAHAKTPIPACRPGIPHLTLDGRTIFSHRTPLQGLSLGPPARPDATPLQYARDHGTAASILPRQRQYAHALAVVPEYGWLPSDRQRTLRVGRATQLDSVLPENARYNLERNTQFVSEMLARNPGSVAADEVVQIRRFEYIGHVFDLQDERGWFNTGGVLSRNCRCSVLPIAEDFEAFETETASASFLDVPEADLCARISATDLARRALHLGLAPPTRAIARRIPELIAERAPSAGGSVVHVLRQQMGELAQNAAASGAVRVLGGTLFTSLWVRAYEGDLAA